MLEYSRNNLIEHVRSQFKIDWHGLHGANHWARVFHHGKYIAQRREADLLVVELFAFLHDSCRFDEGKDLKHGERVTMKRPKTIIAMPIKSVSLNSLPRTR